MCVLFVSLRLSSLPRFLARSCPRVRVFFCLRFVCIAAGDDEEAAAAVAAAADAVDDAAAVPVPDKNT